MGDVLENSHVIVDLMHNYVQKLFQFMEMEMNFRNTFELYISATAVVKHLKDM